MATLWKTPSGWILLYARAHELLCCLWKDFAVNNHFGNRFRFGFSLTNPSISGSSDLRKWLILVRELIHYKMLTLLQAVRISRLANSRHVCHSWAAGDHLQQGLLHSQGGQQTNYQQVCAQQTMKKPYHMQTEAADAFFFHLKYNSTASGNINENVAASWSPWQKNKKKRKNVTTNLQKRKTWHVETCSL